MHKINLSKPYITDEAIDEVVAVLKSGWLTQGKKVAELENRIKDSLGMRYALAVNSATSGLHIALLALGVTQGDEVIVPSFTWVATANVVELCGAKSVFVDIDPDTFNADLEKILDKVNEKTKAIIIVHLFGKPFDVVHLKSRLERHIPIIEDAACALGASINEKACGAMGEVGVFSFHPRKSITTGEGGIVVTNDENLYNRLNMLRNHGQDCRKINTNPSDMFDCPVVGFNFRLTDFQAALALPQFLHLNQLIEYRRYLISIYEEKIGNCPLVKMPLEKENEQHAWQAFVVSVPLELRDIIMDKLAAAGIETRPGTHAVHVLSYYKNKYKLIPEDFLNTYNAFRGTIALPLHNYMIQEDAEYISKKIIEITHDL
jgi:dTDP-4-amino-4,6-dideoxygalactose transaminase